MDEQDAPKLKARVSVEKRAEGMIVKLQLLDEDVSDLVGGAPNLYIQADNLVVDELSEVQIVRVEVSTVTELNAEDFED
jgi:hypothetical protein